MHTIFGEQSKIFPAIPHPSVKMTNVNTESQLLCVIINENLESHEGDDKMKVLISQCVNNLN